PILVVAFVVACLILGIIFYKSSEQRKKTIKAFEFRYTLFLVTSVVVIIYCVDLINAAQNVMKQIQPSLTFLTRYKKCGQARMISACTQVAQKNKESIDESLKTLSDYRNLMRVMQVLAVIFLSLLVVSIVVSLYKFWKVHEIDSSARETRSTRIVNEFITWTIYPILFLVLMSVALSVVVSVMDLGNFEGDVSIAFGIMGMIEGSILLVFSKDLWIFVFKTDWGKTGVNHSLGRVKNHLPHCHLPHRVVDFFR
ncbi:MAG: hypothetical protein L0K43_06460, partial [Bifidobacterium crudilactis]|nr:hypothetical protein [Bifidobacterium crudilactis]